MGIEYRSNSVSHFWEFTMNESLDEAFHLGDFVRFITDHRKAESDGVLGIITSLLVTIQGVRYGVSVRQNESWHYAHELVKNEDGAL